MQPTLYVGVPRDNGHAGVEARGVPLVVYPGSVEGDGVDIDAQEVHVDGDPAGENGGMALGGMGAVQHEGASRTGLPQVRGLAAVPSTAQNLRVGS